MGINTNNIKPFFVHIGTVSHGQDMTHEGSLHFISDHDDRIQINHKCDHESQIGNVPIYDLYTNTVHTNICLSCLTVQGTDDVKCPVFQWACPAENIDKLLYKCLQGSNCQAPIYCTRGNNVYIRENNVSYDYCIKDTEGKQLDCICAHIMICKCLQVSKYQHFPIYCIREANGSYDCKCAHNMTCKCLQGSEHQQCSIYCISEENQLDCKWVYNMKNDEKHNCKCVYAFSEKNLCADLNHRNRYLPV